MLSCDIFFNYLLRVLVESLTVLDSLELKKSIKSMVLF